MFSVVAGYCKRDIADTFFFFECCIECKNAGLRGYQRNALLLRPDESGFNKGMIFSGMYIS